jgi:hypothetical protein
LVADPPEKALYYGIGMKHWHARAGRVLFICLTLALLSAGQGTAAGAQDDPTVVATTDATTIATTGATLDAPTGEPATPTEESATPTPARPVDPRFGVIESHEDPSAAGRLGAAWTRVRFQWAEVQPDGPEDWEPPIEDDELAAELAAGREVVGLLIGLPEWARDRRGLPLGLDRPPDDPANRWGVFVHDVVERYAGRIDRWIIWNEPDIADAGAPGHTWDGSIEEFFQLHRVAYLSATAANPDAAIHLSAFTFFWDPGYFHRFLDILMADPDAATNDYYFDAATAHLYFQPNAVYNILYAFRQVLDDHGLDKPIWLVETNAPPMDDPYWEVDNWTLAVSLNEQAAFVPQAVASALAAGAERIAVYKLKDTEGDRQANPEPFGLIRWDNSRRPAFDTYRVAIRMLAGATTAERERWDAVGQIRLDQPGGSTTVLFARLPDPQQARVRAVADTAELVDMWGRSETIEARRGFFDIALPGALCRQTIADYCMIGSTTYYLVQEFTAAQATRNAPPPASATPQPTRTPLPPVTPTPTTEPSPTVEPSPVASPTAPLPLATPLPAPEMEEIATGTLAAGDTTEPAITGLVVLGLGLALGAGLVVWLAGRRAG